MNRVAFSVVAFLLCTSVAVSAEPTGDDYLKFFKPLAGNWTVKAKIGDKNAEGTFTCRLSQTKRCLVWYGSAMASYPAAQSVDGFDPATKKWTGCAYTAAGDRTITTCVVDDPAALKGKEATFTVEMTEIKADGKINKWQVKNVFILGKDECKIIAKEQMRNGEKLPDEEFVYQRRINKNR
jgi:hypothetical protein